MPCSVLTFALQGQILCMVMAQPQPTEWQLLNSFLAIFVPYAVCV
jgi:hypothetical protein